MDSFCYMQILVLFVSCDCTLSSGFTLFHRYGNTPGNLVTNNGRKDEVNMNIKKDSGFKVFKGNHLGKCFQEEQNAFNTFC